MASSAVVDLSHRASIRSPARKRLPALTGLRLLAALYVVSFHYAPPLSQGFDVFTSAGYSAVSLFFILSGFVLAYNHIDMERDAITVDRGRFWLSRFARVYPAYLLALALMAPVFISSMMENTESNLRVIGRVAVFGGMNIA